MPPPLLAFGIANLPMLGWLAAAAAPIVIHLWNRRQHREMPWAAMEYLLAAVQRQSRRLLVEQWLLLAIRTLLVVLVVLVHNRRRVVHLFQRDRASDRPVDGAAACRGFSPGDRAQIPPPGP